VPTRFDEFKKTALLVVDMQVGVVANAFRRTKVIANINQLVSNARNASVPIIWVQHSDSELVMHSADWQIVSELHPIGEEKIIHKKFGDSFEATELQKLLLEQEIGRLVVCGAQTDACIRSTLHGAIGRGFDAVLVGDAHTTDDCQYSTPQVSAESIVAHTNFYWNWQRTSSATGGTFATADIHF